MSSLLQIVLGLALSLIIGLLAYRVGALSRSGVIGAALTGTAIFGFGGLGFGLVLITFFITSSALSRYRRTEKETVAEEKFDKTSQRDLGQALANAGVASIFAILYFLAKTTPIGFSPNFALAGFVGAMATATADTWATEIGVLSTSPPRMITSFKTVEMGTSGGVTGLGTLAMGIGALLIGIASLWFVRFQLGLLTFLQGASFSISASSGAVFNWLIPASLLGGFAGSLFDSFLGATVQAMYYSPYREKETEKVIDPNGKPNEHIRGWVWLNNDWVNFLSTGVGALVAVILFTLL